MGFADARAATAKMQHGGRGNGDLGRKARGHLAFQVLEVRQLNVAGVAHLVHHADHRGREFLGAIGLGLAIESVRSMIADYQQRFNRTIYFVDGRGTRIDFGPLSTRSIPLHQQPAYSKWAEGTFFPNSERLAQRVISLPMHSDVSEFAQDSITQVLKGS